MESIWSVLQKKYKIEGMNWKYVTVLNVLILIILNIYSQKLEFRNDYESFNVHVRLYISSSILRPR
jgi:hypothetical protein